MIVNRRRLAAVVGVLVGALVALFLLLHSVSPHVSVYSGCMASCPTPPAGCQRTSIDPGSCTEDSGCTSPAPVCHFAPLSDSDGTVCPPTMPGRCIPPK